MATQKKVEPSVLEGKVAPKFKLPATTGVDINLADFKGSTMVVLYFYPKDGTPGCTIEAKDFQDLKGRFTRNNAIVLGISPDDLASHMRFCKENKLNFPLLVDKDSKVAAKYKVWKEKSVFGRTFMAVDRSTFVIDIDGKIKKAWNKVKVSGHAKEVLEYVKSLKKPTPEPEPKPKTAKKKTEKAAAKKPAAKKTATKKIATKKPAVKKAAAKKSTTKKPVVKKTAAKKPSTKKVAAKKSEDKKKTAKKATSKKAATKKTTAKKTVKKKK